MTLTRICAISIALGLAAGGAQAESSHGAPKTADHGTVAAAKDHGKAASGHQQASKDAGQGGAHWGYEGRTGPSHWGQLSKDYHLCMLGATQSPIDIGAAPFDGATVAPIAFDYRLSPVEIVNNGHTIQLNYAPGSAITVRGTRFELLQVHFHTPSEHAIGGRRAPMEAHLVHRSAEGELAVVGVMIEEGEESLALSEFWNLMPRQAGDSKRDKRTLVNARDLLPHDPGYYRYMGSLTTPPCSEGVNWHVMATPVGASAQQIQQFEQIIGANARPVQAVNRRLVLAPNGNPNGGPHGHHGAGH